MNSTHNSKLSGNAKALRRNMTKEERHLWYDFLKTLPIMVHRQKVIGKYIVDFYVAGGIGSGINMKNSVNIGMLPDVELEKYHYIGNSSLTGAYALVMSDEANAKCTELGANMTYLELSTYPGYMDSFVAACFLPHTNSSLFPNSIQE